MTKIPSRSCFKPLHQSEAWCITIHIILSLSCNACEWNLIFIRSRRLALIWERGQIYFGNGPINLVGSDDAKKKLHSPLTSSDRCTEYHDAKKLWRSLQNCQGVETHWDLARLSADELWNHRETSLLTRDIFITKHLVASMWLVFLLNKSIYGRWTYLGLSHCSMKKK